MLGAWLGRSGLEVLGVKTPHPAFGHLLPKGRSGSPRNALRSNGRR
jgi:hypothetical protein